MGKTATREAYGRALAELGDTYDFVVLDADLSKSTKTDTFKQKFPERFFNTGIAEANMMSVAAGIAILRIIRKENQHEEDQSPRS